MTERRKVPSAGEVMVARLQERYAFDTRETVLLELAARQADDVALLEALLKADGLVVEGSTGRPRLSAVVTELRQQRLALAKLIAELQLPSEDLGEQLGRSPASRRAQAAARSRWDRVRREQERHYGASS